MTLKEARQRAQRLGLSAWVVQFVPAGGSVESAKDATRVHRIGYSSLNFAIAEGTTWDEAWRRATQVIFGA
ncbi:MAG TPA: hypothetical protein VFU59_07065 [Candidatus Eisenbacteria bacterium]|nr:hypothetical protein [Candidatus Eisenbacteria bacterium]